MSDHNRIELLRDARRYRRLQILGCAPATRDNQPVMRFSNLDEFVDDDLEHYPSRGEADYIAAREVTPSEQQANAKPQDEAEMREVAISALAKIKGALGHGATVSHRSANDMAALAELRTYASTERDRAREDRAGEIAGLHGIIRELHWMARRYADGRMTYAVGNFNDITRRLCDADIIRARDYQADGTPWARDGDGNRRMDGLSADEAAMGCDWVNRDQARREADALERSASLHTGER